MSTLVLVALVVGYLLGSLPFGFLVARAKGVNIFEVGSKNPGATNVRRVLGSGPGNLVFALDALKGAIATGWPFVHVDSTVSDATKSFGISIGAGDAAVIPLAVAGLVGALLGHSFSCFTRFRGGKGVATASGGLIVLMPLAVAIGAVVWAATFYSSRYVSLASIFAALSMPASAYLLDQEPVLLGLTVVIAVLVVVRHRTNIQRLLNGTESRFAKKSVPKP